MRYRRLAGSVLFCLAALTLLPAAQPVRHRAVEHPSPTGAPIAIADSYSTQQNTIFSVAAPGLFENDSLQGGSLTAYGASTGLEQTALGTATPTTQGGSVALNADGSFVYTPLNGFAGQDTFHYTVANSAGSAEGTVFVTVTAAPPVATSDAFGTHQGSSLTVAAPGVLANDTLNGASIAGYGASSGSEQTSAGSITPTAQGGSISLNADGSFTYTPAATFAGTDTFRYMLANAAGNSTATVSIAVTAAPPAAAADSYTTPQGTALNQPAPGVLSNDTRNGGTIVSYGASSGSEQRAIGGGTATAKGGTIALNADGSFRYTPAAAFSGSDTFRYVLQNSGGSSTGTVTVTVQAPAGADFSVSSPGFFYTFSGVSGQNPVLTLTRGRTYRFQINTSSIHPFEILGAPAGSVTNNNISSGIITFTVPMTAQNYAYQCSIHGFGNTIKTTP